MKARVVTLESQIAQPTLEVRPDTELSVKDELTVDSVLSCLDVAESIAKMLPVVGSLVEGACGTVRKIIAAAQVRVYHHLGVKSVDILHRVQSQIKRLARRWLHTRQTSHLQS